MKLPSVVRIRRSKGIVVQDCDLYIGRRCTMGGWNLEQSIWHNPFTIKKYGSAEEVCKLYREYILNNSNLMSKLPELEGKRLGCWCDGTTCHGHVLIDLFKALLDF